MKIVDYFSGVEILCEDAMIYYILIFLEYTLPSLVLTGFAVWPLWQQLLNKRH
jgi:hypothetical protein